MAAWPEFRLDRLLGGLTARGVDFVVIGGVAATVHGSAHITRDLDIRYSTEPANLEALGAALGDLGARLRGVEDDVDFVPDARTLKDTQVLTLETREGWLDLLAEPAGGPPYEKLRKRADRIEFKGLTLLVASIDDLIAMKSAAGRDRDMVAVEELKLIRRLRKRVKPDTAG